MSQKLIDFILFARSNPTYLLTFLIKKFRYKIYLLLPFSKKMKIHLYRHKTDEHSLFLMRYRHAKVQQLSPTACTAKWLQLTLTLQNGMNHSCHHPPPHKIPLDELNETPKALHNTKFKKQQRKLMLDGLKPNECEYCWNIEDLSEDHFSDRVYKNSDLKWSMNHLSDVVQARDTHNLAPTYLEVSFENTCNLTCSYCVPENSSSWHQEIKKHGAYPTSYRHGDLGKQKEDGKSIYTLAESNPYLEAFWDWWPELHKSLEVFRITGGEPLLSLSTWKVIEYLQDNPRPSLDFALNSNLCVPQERINKLVNAVNLLNGKVKSFTVYTSCEAAQEQAEYIRFGLNYKKFLENIEQLLSQTPKEFKVSFIITFNALSLSSFINFLEDLRELRDKYRVESFERIEMMISYLRWPKHMSAKALPREIKQPFVAQVIEYINKNSIKNQIDGYLHETEVDQLHRLCHYIMEDTQEQNQMTNRKDFALYFNEFDRRKGTSFHKTFPQLSKYMDECQSLLNQ